MEDWIEHRRGLDRELLGWMRPEGDGFIVIDLLGRERTGVVDWFVAEEFLEQLGLGYLAEKYDLWVDNAWLPVEVVEVSPTRIRLRRDYGAGQAVGSPQMFHEIDFPAEPEVLRTRAR